MYWNVNLQESQQVSTVVNQNIKTLYLYGS